jgi:hypothetical protein
MLISFELNVGLNNNPLEVYEIQRYFSTNFDIDQIETFTSEYSKEPETAVYLKGTYYASLGSFIKKLESMSQLIRQECIAVKTNLCNTLVYSTGYKGDYQLFDEQYFKSHYT